MTKSYKDNIEVFLSPGNKEINFEYEFKTPVISVLEGSVGLNPKFQVFIETLETLVKKQMVIDSEKLFNGKIFTQERIDDSFDTSISGNILKLNTDNVKWFGQDNKKCKPEESGTCIIKVNKVKFNGRFSLDMELVKVKAARKNERIDLFNVEEPVSVTETEPEIQEPVSVTETEQDFW